LSSQHQHVVRASRRFAARWSPIGTDGSGPQAMAPTGCSSHDRRLSVAAQHACDDRPTEHRRVWVAMPGTQEHFA
jgi:hypothetical protein